MMKEDVSALHENLDATQKLRFPARPQQRSNAPCS